MIMSLLNIFLCLNL